MKLLVILSMLFSFTAMSNEVDQKYFTIKDVKVYDLGENFVLADKGFELGPVIDIIGNLIGLGTKIFDFIKENRPTMTTDFYPLSVLPRVGGSDLTGIAFYNMTNWSLPKVVKKRMVVTNQWGSEVISFDYAIQYQFWGKYEGKGAYITGLTVIPDEIKVGWGWNLDVRSRVLSISNIGGSLEEPLATATLQLDCAINNAITNVRKSYSFTVIGDGRFVAN